MSSLTGFIDDLIPGNDQTCVSKGDLKKVVGLIEQRLLGVRELPGNFAVSFGKDEKSLEVIQQTEPDKLPEENGGGV
jgi:hypothetical protein